MLLFASECAAAYHTRRLLGFEKNSWASRPARSTLLRPKEKVCSITSRLFSPQSRGRRPLPSSYVVERETRRRRRREATEEGRPGVMWVTATTWAVGHVAAGRRDATAAQPATPSRRVTGHWAPPPPPADLPRTAGNEARFPGEAVAFRPHNVSVLWRRRTRPVMPGRCDVSEWYFSDEVQDVVIEMAEFWCMVLEEPVAFGIKF